MRNDVHHFPFSYDELKREQPLSHLSILDLTRKSTCTHSEQGSVQDKRKEIPIPAKFSRQCKNTNARTKSFTKR